MLERLSIYYSLKQARLKLDCVIVDRHLFDVWNISNHFSRFKNHLSLAMYVISKQQRSTLHCVIIEHRVLTFYQIDPNIQLILV